MARDISQELARERLQPCENESYGLSKISLCHAVMTRYLGGSGAFLSLGDKEKVLAVKQIAVPCLI